jgi:hypothetical protein
MARPLLVQSQWSMIEGHGILVSGESVSRFVLQPMFPKRSIPSSGQKPLFFVRLGRTAVDVAARLPVGFGP